MENERFFQGKQDLRSFSSDLIVYGLGQIIVLVLGIVQLLILPKYLSMDDYGYFRVFILYGSYVGILHLGFIDGALVRWAGKQLPDITHEVRISIRFLLLEQVLIILPLMGLSFFIFNGINKTIALLILIYALIANVSTLFMFIFQAVKKFKLLTIFNIGRQAIFLVLLIPIIILGFATYFYVIVAMLCTFLATLILFIMSMKIKPMKESSHFSSAWLFGKSNINIGIYILSGNFIYIIFTTIDRLLVNYHFSIVDFAIYNFSVSVSTSVYTLVSAVSQVFFPYLAALEDDAKTYIYQMTKPAVTLFWAATLIIYFPFTKFIEFYLPNYLESLPILKILLCTVGFCAPIQILHINYYKAYKKQKLYFINGAIALVFAFILYLVIIQLYGTLISIAFVTLISFLFWYLVNIISLRSIFKETTKQMMIDIAVIGCFVIGFFISFFIFEYFLYQMIVYVILFIIITRVFLKNQMAELLQMRKYLNITKRL